MATIKIKSMYFQRNGVGGEPFYHALISYKEPATIPVNNMLVTFQVCNKDNVINWKTLRAVDLDNIQEAWRGDNIAGELQAYFNKQMKEKGGTIYDFCNKKIYAV